MRHQLSVFLPRRGFRDPAGTSGDQNTNKAFFDAHFRQTLVINGVHSETNGHDEGTRAHATGRLDMGYPNVAELFAFTYGRGMPMPWLNSGGFRTSAGLVPPTRVPDANAWRALTQPNAASASNDFMKQADVTRTQLARAERMKALQARGDLMPRSKNAVEEFLGAADSRALLQRVSQLTPATFDAFTQAHIGLIAAQAGRVAQEYSLVQRAEPAPPHEQARFSTFTGITSDPSLIIASKIHSSMQSRRICSPPRDSFSINSFVFHRCGRGATFSRISRRVILRYIFGQAL